MITGYDAYQIYLGIHLHFNNIEYDFFQYKGKTNTSKIAFESRKDKYTFYKLSRKYGSIEEITKFLVSNYAYRDIKWSGDLMTDAAEKAYKMYLKNTQTITYTFIQDFQKLLDNCTLLNCSLDDMFKVKHGQDPQLLVYVYRGEVTLETFILLDMLMGFSPIWEKRIDDNIIFPKFIQRCKKYKSWFGEYDLNKFREIMKEKVKCRNQNSK